MEKVFPSFPIWENLFREARAAEKRQKFNEINQFDGELRCRHDDCRENLLIVAPRVGSVGRVCRKKGRMCCSHSGLGVQRIWPNALQATGRKNVGKTQQKDVDRFAGFRPNATGTIYRGENTYEGRRNHSDDWPCCWRGRRWQDRGSVHRVPIRTPTARSDICDNCSAYANAAAVRRRLRTGSATRATATTRLPRTTSATASTSVSSGRSSAGRSRPRTASSTTLRTAAVDGVDFGRFGTLFGKAPGPVVRQSAGDAVQRRDLRQRTGSPLSGSPVPLIA